MTSYSTYAVGAIKYVDGDLTHEHTEVREAHLHMLQQCVAAGAMRALLDTASDLADRDAQIDATQWQSPREGWELEALYDDDREAFESFVDQFVTENLLDVICLAERIAWAPRYLSQVWHGHSGMGMYRVGYLLGMQRSGNGVGFEDYHDPRYSPCDVTDRLTAWLNAHKPNAWEGAWIDSEEEEPCLLHLAA